MSQFVDECRREWKRLGVPEAVANEMASDLAADLEEAEADGVSAEDVLGRAVFDARSFAASWAGERGVIPPPSVKSRRSRRSRALTVVAVVIAVVAIAVAVGILTNSSESLAVKPIPGQRIVLPARPVAPPLKLPVDGQVAARADLRPLGWMLLIAGVGGLVLATALSTRGSLRRVT